MQNLHLPNKLFTRMDFRFIFVAMATLLLFTNCEKGDDFGYKHTEDIRDDVEVFTDLMIRKQAMVLNLLKYSSDNFTKKPFEGTISRAEADEFFKQVQEMAENIEEYEKAINQLEKSGILNKGATRGLYSSAKNFLGWLSGSSKRSRNRVLTVASNLSENDRSQLYNNLRSEWKNKASNEKDFWEKLEKGTFDNQASQMYNDFIIDNDEFAITAVEKGLTIQKIVVAEGTTGVNAGADLMVDIIGTAVPGAGTGIATVNVINNTHELVAKDGTWAEKGILATKILADVTGIDADSAIELMTDIKNIDAAAESLETTVKILQASNEPSTITNNKDFGIAKVNDGSTSGKADIVIAQNEGQGKENAPSIMVAIGSVIEKGNEYINTILSTGNWLISAIDQQGNVDAQKVQITPGDEIIVYVITEEQEEDEDNDNDKDSKDWDKHAKTYPIMNRVPKFSYPIYSAKKVDVDAYGSTSKGVGLAFGAGVMTMSNLDTYLAECRQAGFTVERDTDYETGEFTRYYHCYIQYSPGKYDRLGITIFFSEKSMSQMTIAEVITNY